MMTSVTQSPMNLLFEFNPDRDFSFEMKAYILD